MKTKNFAANIYNSLSESNKATEGQIEFGFLIISVAMLCVSVCLLGLAARGENPITSGLIGIGVSAISMLSMYTYLRLVKDSEDTKKTEEK